MAAIIIDRIITAEQAGELAEAIYSIVDGSDHKPTRNAALAEIEDWLMTGEWEDGQQADPAALAEEWRAYVTQG